MQHATLTVGEAIARSVERLTASGSESARLDAEVLLGSALGIDRTGIIAYPTAPLGPGQARTFASYIDRRCDGEPVAYIRGIKEFYGLAISVDARVLIPRPETEKLVTLVIDRVREILTSAPRPVGSAPLLIWDIGTGSGAIPVAIASELRQRRYGEAVRFHLSDASTDALDVAKLNAAAHGLADLMTFAAGDLGEASLDRSGTADIIVANLPYVPTGSFTSLPIATSFEPRAALDGGADGLVVIRRLLTVLPDLLPAKGLALLEIGADQGDAITAAVAEALRGWSTTLHPDLSGQVRVAELQRIGG